MKKIIILSFISTLLLAVGNHSYATEKTIEPNGMFFNRFSGGFSGTEWFQTFYVPETQQYHMADIFGGGFLGVISADGKVILEQELGKGEFSDSDHYIVKPTLGGTLFTFVCNRAPYTDKDFILKLDKPHAANAKLSGQWRATIEVINPETGAASDKKTQDITVKSSGTTLRITDPQGQFMQGVFARHDTVAFRKIVPEPTKVGFASFEGSDVNVEQNVLGQIEFTGNNKFSGIFLMQTRTPLGSQEQKMLRYTASRKPLL